MKKRTIDARHGAAKPPARHALVWLAAAAAALSLVGCSWWGSPAAQRPPLHRPSESNAAGSPSSGSSSSGSPTSEAPPSGGHTSETGASDPTQPATPAPWVDASQSPFQVRGIVEGFYGTPWTHDQRLATFDFMKHVSLNTYVYAPKDDPYQRTEWRTAYPAERITDFRELLDRAQSDGVRFVYSISPGLDVTYSSVADRAALAGKLTQLEQLGVHTFMLSLDDVPAQLNTADQKAYGKTTGGSRRSHGAAYAVAQASLANWLYNKMRTADPSFTLWLTPTTYNGTAATPYLTALGERLDTHIPVVWTGPAVLSRRITAADAKKIDGILRRKVIVWDNFPVNDYTYAQQHKPRLLLGPVRDRGADLASEVDGFLSNPMIQPLASQMPLYTVAAYLADPSDYDPAAAWQAGAAHLAAKGGAAGLLDFASYAQFSPFDRTPAPELAAALAAYRKNRTSPAAADRLRAAFQRMRDVAAALPQAVSPAWYVELKPWAAELDAKGAAGLAALAVDRALVAGDTATVQAKLPALKKDAAGLKKSEVSAQIAQGLVDDFVQQVVKRAG